MKAIFKFLLYLLALIPATVFSQNSSNKGTDFWIGFPAHGDGTRADMFLYVTGDSSTTGTVSIPGQSWSTNFTITANAMTLISVPTSRAYVSCDDCIEARGINLVSKKKVVVYSHIYYRYRSDATLVLPTPTTGKEYYAMSYGQIGPSRDRSQFMIIASQDKTKVRITPTTDLSKSGGGTRSSGTAYEITLDAGEVYQGRAKNRSFTDDVTGTHIEVIDTGSNAACKTVAVFSGSSNNFIGCNVSGGGITSRDNLYQQLYPTKSWGTRFVTIPFKGRKEDNIRILASTDKTRVIINYPTGAPKIVDLDAGEWWPVLNRSTPLYILAGKPISVAQFQESQKCGGTGDPSMTILNPIEQTLKQITVYSSEYEDIDDHYINVIIPTKYASSFRIDSKTVSWTKVPKLNSHSYARIDVNQGNHRMSADGGFNAIAYGFGRYESYGYAAGANVKDLTAQLELVNSAELDENSICLGDSSEFEGQAEYSVKKWEWDFGDGTTKFGQFPSHLYKDTGTYTVILYTHKTNFDGCSSYDSSDMEIRVNAKPTANFVTSARCEGNTITFTDSSKAPPGGNIGSRQWIFHNSSIYATKTTKYYDTAGTYKVKLVVKTDFQCPDTMEIDMVVNPNPIADIDIEDVCFKDSSYFLNTSTVKTGGIESSKWQFGDGDSSTANNPVHFYQDSGTYYVSLITTTDSGCSNSTMDTLYKYPSFTLDFTYTDTCAGLAVNFVNTSTATAGTIDDYLWEFTGGVTYTTTNVQHQFATPGTTIVRLLGTHNNYCRDSVDKVVVIDPLVSADFKVNGLCMNDSVTFINTSTVGSGVVSNAIWNLDDGITAQGDTVKTKYTSNGLKDITMISISDQGCADTSSQQIQIVNPEITKLNFPTVCAGTTAKIYATLSLDGDDVDTYSWDADGYLATTDTLFFNTSNPSLYNVELTAQTKGGCTMYLKDSFTVYAIPVPDFTVTDVCAGYNIPITNNSVIGNGESINSYEWYLNGSLASSSRDPSIVATPEGNASLRLVTSSKEGCKDELTKNFEIYAVPSAGFTVANTCLGETTTFQSTSSISSGSIISFDWTYDDAVTDVGTTVTRTYPTDGNYSVKLALVSDNGCSDSFTRNFAINPKPQLDITVDKITGCQPLLVQFTDNSTINSGSIDNYDWDFGDGTTATGLQTFKVYDNVGSYQVVVYATSDANCMDTFIMSNPIDVLAKPTAAFTYTPLEPSLLFPDVNFINGSSSDATSFLWDLGDGSTFTSRDVPYIYSEPGDYNITLVVTADNGCKDTVVNPIYIKLDFFIWIPTVFSPNGDLNNDVFRVHGLIPDIQGYSMQIFNRWGEVVFETVNPNDVWDGTYQGIEVPSSSYGYAVRYVNYETGRWESKQGAIKIIR
jgi:gliding motility-associated-like protein